MSAAHYGPPDGSRAPRYAGVRTFARCPHTSDLDGVDVAVLGAPFDTATSFRPGARFGPEGIRAGSQLLRPYHPAHGIDVFDALSVADRGDVDVTPGNASRTMDQIAGGVAAVVQAGAVPLVLGGDHLVTLGELRGHAEAVGEPPGLVLLDAHADVWDDYYGERLFHGTVFRRAVEEGVVDPGRSVLSGMRGPLYDPADIEVARELGFEVIDDTELDRLDPSEWSRRVRARVGDRPVCLSFDIDVVDPGFAPGTGTPEVAGLTPRRVLELLRSLAGVSFVGFDVVEVSPPYDPPGTPTALLAANVGWEMLALAAIAPGD